MVEEEYNDLGKIVRVGFWTEGAVDCYNRGCTCNENCLNFRIMGRKCNMKACVLESVRTLGLPTRKGVNLVRRKDVIEA